MMSIEYFGMGNRVKDKKILAQEIIDNTALSCFDKAAAIAKTLL